MQKQSHSVKWHPQAAKLWRICNIRMEGKKAKFVTALRTGNLSAIGSPLRE